MKFKQFSEKGYKHYTENTIEELDELHLNNPDIITEFAHLCEWLRINHDIWIEVYIDDNKTFGYLISRFTKDGRLDYPLIRNFNSPQEATSVAFDYILKEIL